MFDPTFPQQGRKVDFSGRPRAVENKQALLSRTRQERQQRQHLQNQHTAATLIQRWYRSHKQRQRTRPALRTRYDTDWQRYTQSLGSQAADGGGRQRALTSLVRLLWLFYDNGADGMRLVSLVAAIVKSNNDHSVHSPHSYFHTATPATPVSSLPWSLQASNLCVLCLSKLIHDSPTAAAATSTPTSASSAVAASDKRVYSLVLAALTLLLDQSKWNTKGTATTDPTSITAQHQQLQQALSSLSSPFFPALHILLSRLSLCDVQRSQTPYIAALLSAVLKCCGNAAAGSGVYDSFTRRVVSNVLSIPLIASYVCSSDQLRLLLTADGGRLLSLLVSTSLSISTTTPALLNTPSLALTSVLSASIPASVLLLANLVQLMTLQPVSEHTIDTLLAYLQLLSHLIPTIPPHLLAPTAVYSGSQPTNGGGRPSPAPSSLRLSSHSIARSPPLTNTHFTQLQHDVSKQFLPLFSSSSILSLINSRLSASDNTKATVHLLSSYSLTAFQCRTPQRSCSLRSVHSCTRIPSYLPLVASLITLLVDRSPTMRPTLSSLTFTTPILPMLWRQMEVTVGWQTHWTLQTIWRHC